MVQVRSGATAASADSWEPPVLDTAAQKSTAATDHLLVKKGWDAHWTSGSKSAFVLWNLRKEKIRPCKHSTLPPLVNEMEAEEWLISQQAVCIQMKALQSWLWGPMFLSYFPVVNKGYHQYYWCYHGCCPPSRETTDHPLLQDQQINIRSCGCTWGVQTEDRNELYERLLTYPAPLCHKPAVDLLPDDLEDPADDHLDVL